MVLLYLIECGQTSPHFQPIPVKSMIHAFSCSYGGNQWLQAGKSNRGEAGVNQNYKYSVNVTLTFHENSTWLADGWKHLVSAISSFIEKLLVKNFNLCCVWYSVSSSKINHNIWELYLSFGPSIQDWLGWVTLVSPYMRCDRWPNNLMFSDRNPNYSV